MDINLKHVGKSFFRLKLKQMKITFNLKTYNHFHSSLKSCLKS